MVTETDSHLAESRAPNVLEPIGQGISAVILSVGVNVLWIHTGCVAEKAELRSSSLKKGRVDRT